MSEQYQMNDDQDQTSSPTPEVFRTLRTSSRLGIQEVLLYIALGILVGVLFVQKAKDFLPSVLPALMAVFIALLLLIIVLIIALPRIFNYLAKRYTGQDMDIENAVGEIQTKVNHIADTLTSYTLAKANPEVRKNIRKDIPAILNYLVFARLRSSGIRLLITVFVAIGGLMGTILLYNQNELLQKQNEKIDNQILLEEASRRSSLNFLMGNVLDKIDEELKDRTNERRLSPQLIGRISSLSQSFQPYLFMEDGNMMKKPLSPERGNLLLALVNSNLDTFTLYTIFQKTTFRDANLRGAILDSIYFVGVDLSGADLKNASLNGAHLSGADLRNTALRGADFTGADLNSTILTDSDLRDAVLTGVNLNDANLKNADLRMTDLSGADFSGADLTDANLTDAIFLGADFSDANLSNAVLHIGNIFISPGMLRRDLKPTPELQVDFSCANLSSADLSGADFSATIFRDAILYKANLKGTVLLEADFRNADLSKADLSKARGINIEMLKSCASIYHVENLPDSIAVKLKIEIEKEGY